MSNTALLERPAATAAIRTAAPAPAAAPLDADLPAVRSPRGFALYVGLDEIKAAEAGVSLPLLVDALRRTLAELAPGAETHATVALAPHGSGAATSTSSGLHCTSPVRSPAPRPPLKRRPPTKRVASSSTSRASAC